MRRDFGLYCMGQQLHLPWAGHVVSPACQICHLFIRKEEEKRLEKLVPAPSSQIYIEMDDVSRCVLPETAGPDGW